MLGTGKKNPEMKKFPIRLLSHPNFYNMEANSFPVTENAENKPDLPCVHFIHAEGFSILTKSNLMHIAPWSEDDMRQLSNCSQWFLFLKEMKSLSVLENHNNPPQ